MNTAVLTIKTNPDLKVEVQKIAAELGFSLSSLINAYLKHLALTKTVFFSLVFKDPGEYLSSKFMTGAANKS